MPYRCSGYCSLNIECLHFAASWKYMMIHATMKLGKAISLAVHALSKSGCLVPRVQTNTKFGFSFTVFFFFPRPSTVYLSEMSVLRSLRQLSVASGRAVALRSAPAARLRFPMLATCASVSATRAFSVSARSLAEGACQYHFPICEHTNTILIPFNL